MQLVSYWVKSGDFGPRLDIARSIGSWNFERWEIDLESHCVQKVDSLVVINDSVWTWLEKSLTGLACQRCPPISNHDRWPPSEVVHRTVYGFCLNSSDGMAALPVIYIMLMNTAWGIDARLTGSSEALIAKNGIFTASNESTEEASR